MGFWGAIRQIWTIARLSITQAIRMKIVIIVIVFMVLLVPTIPFILKTDDTPMGQARMIITYCTYLTTFLLTVLTLFLSAATLNSEIKHQHIFLLDPKPVRRGVVLLGKWLGVMLINLALLSAMLGITYGLVRWFARDRSDQVREEFREPVKRQYELLRANLLTARAAESPPLPDIREWVEKEVERIREAGYMPERKSEDWVRKKVAERLSRGAWTVPPDASITWTVSNVPKFDGLLFVSFRHYGSGTPKDSIRGEFTLEGEDYVHRQPVHALVGAGHAFPVSPLYPAGSLAENFVRAGIIILFKLTFIAIVGIFASTFLSFPVAVLLTMVVVLVGHLAGIIFSDFLRHIFIVGSSMVQPDAPLHPVDEAIRAALYFFFKVFFPDFTRYDVVDSLSNSRLIRNLPIFWCFVRLLVIRGGILALLGWIFYRRRELAALTTTT